MYSWHEVGEVRIIAKVRGIETSVFATDQRSVTGFSAFNGAVLSCAIYPFWDEATVLRTMIDLMVIKNIESNIRNTEHR